MSQFPFSLPCPIQFACGIVPGIPHHDSEASLAPAQEGTPEQLLGTLGRCPTAGPCARGKPTESRAGGPTALPGNWAHAQGLPAPQSLRPAPSPPGAVALCEGGGCSEALGASTRNSGPFLSPHQSQSPLVRPVQCVNVPVCHRRII